MRRTSQLGDHLYTQLGSNHTEVGFESGNETRYYSLSVEATVCTRWLVPSSPCRWDLQRLRARREHEELLRKYMQKSGGNQTQSKDKKKDKLPTFAPKTEECERMHTPMYCMRTICGTNVPLPKIRVL